MVRLMSRLALDNENKIDLTKFTETEEDSVNDSEGCDVRGQSEKRMAISSNVSSECVVERKGVLLVKPAHQESNESLEHEADNLVKAN